MTKKNTPLQTLLNVLNKSISDCGKDSKLIDGLKLAKILTEKLLPAERQAIEQAFRDGKNDAYQLFEDQFIPSDYFTSKYN